MHQKEKVNLEMDNEPDYKIKTELHSESGGSSKPHVSNVSNHLSKTIPIKCITIPK